MSFTFKGICSVAMLSRGTLALGCALVLAACASTQLNYNTLELASTVGDIQTKQVLFNLSMLLDNPGAIPAHIDLSSGTATTTNSVSPTFGTPLNTASSVVDTVAKVASASPSTTTTSQLTSTTAGATASVQLQDQWVQNWGYDPVIAGDELRRLRSLYRYGLGLINDHQLISEYPLITKALAVTYGSPGTMPIYNDPVYCPDIGLRTDGSSKDITGAPQQNVVTGAKCGTVPINIQIPDDQYLHEPSCIICIGRYEIYTRRSRLWVNPKLRELHGRWLLTEADTLPPDVKFLGNFAKHSLYIRNGELDRLSEFTLFVLTTTTQSSAAAAASSPAGGGGGGGKTKANAPAVITGGGSNSPALVFH